MNLKICSNSIFYKSICGRLFKADDQPEPVWSLLNGRHREAHWWEKKFPSVYAACQHLCHSCLLRLSFSQTWGSWAVGVALWEKPSGAGVGMLQVCLPQQTGMGIHSRPWITSVQWRGLKDTFVLEVTVSTHTKSWSPGDKRAAYEIRVISSNQSLSQSPQWAFSLCSEGYILSGIL